MSLCGKAVVAIWNGITPEGRDNFIEWHNREHIPERVAIPGFLRGRRYEAIYGAPAYFTLYEAADAAVLSGEDYLMRLNNPTDWTRRSTAQFTDTSRGVCDIVHSAGWGDGGLVVTFRFDPPPAHAERLRAKLLAQLPLLEQRLGISGTHLCIADQAVSGMETAERKGRAVGVPNWIVLLEGGSENEVDAAADALMAAVFADEPETAAELQRGLYRLQYSRAG